VLLPYSADDAYTARAVHAYREAAGQLGVVLVERAVRTQEEARTTLSALRRADVDGIVAPATLSLNIPGFVLDATSERAIPAMFNGAFYVERGGLVSYGSDDGYETGRLAARLVDKIVKGEDPGRIPVEVSAKIELAINVKTAKTLKLAIPASILQRANRVIE
jgi:putative ABC transport system substrate-binding protein